MSLTGGSLLFLIVSPSRFHVCTPRHGGIPCRSLPNDIAGINEFFGRAKKIKI
jgi:hypothetical protein